MATLADVEAAFKATLGGDGTLASLATGGVYHLRATQNTADNYVVYQCIDDLLEGVFDEDAINAAFQVMAYGNARNDADDVRAILDRCFTLLHRQDIATGSLLQCTCTARGYGLLQAEADQIIGSVDFSVYAQ